MIRCKTITCRREGRPSHRRVGARTYIKNTESIFINKMIGVESIHI